MDSDMFFKFPKTPHMSGSEVVDDDEVVSDQQFDSILRLGKIRRVIVQEKVDGTNISVHFLEEWTPILQKRSGLIGQGERQQYNLFRDYVFSKLELFWSICGTQYCVFGEGLWQQHTIGYDQLPDFFVVFDVLDKSSGQFLSYEKVVSLIAGRLTVVPLVLNLQVDKDSSTKLSDLIKEKMLTKSNYGKETQEGLYVRFETDEHVSFRFKIRRKSFVSGRTDFDKNPIKNKLKQ